MKTIGVSVDGETHRLARIRAAETGATYGISIQPISRELFTVSTEMADRFRISYWDAAILAAAKTLRCDAVYSENLSDLQDCNGVRVINPFLENPATV